jgi:hypothetical protein
MWHSSCIWAKAQHEFFFWILISLISHFSFLRYQRVLNPLEVHNSFNHIHETYGGDKLKFQLNNLASDDVQSIHNTSQLWSRKLKITRGDTGNKWRGHSPWATHGCRKDLPNQNLKQEFAHIDYLHFTSVRKGKGSMTNKNKNFKVNGQMEPITISCIKKQFDANGIRSVPWSRRSIILGYRRGNLTRLDRYL